MTTLAINCALLEIPVDPARLFYDYDPFFLVWLQGVVDRVERKHREDARRAKKT